MALFYINYFFLAWGALWLRALPATFFTGVELDGLFKILEASFATGFEVFLQHAMGILGDNIKVS